MSDWDFLYDMHALGYSAEEIADASACGYAPYERLIGEDDLQDEPLKTHKKKTKKSLTRLYPERCRVIFLDFEFYVPAQLRVDNTFCYNPWDKASKFLGGAIMIANPVRDFDISDQQLHNKIKSMFLWNYKSERELLVDIYNQLNKIQKQVKKSHNNRVSPIICGIGISSSDIPILFELFKRYHILSNADAFRFLNKFRLIDLSQLAIASFNNSNNFLYPKTKNELLNKYTENVKFESGTSVWGLYEEKNFKKIEKRTRAEIYETYHCYKHLYADFSRFKRLEKNDNKRQKMEQKNNIDNNGVD